MAIIVVVVINMASIVLVVVVVAAAAVVDIHVAGVMLSPFRRDYSHCHCQRRLAVS